MLIILSLLVLMALSGFAVRSNLSSFFRASPKAASVRYRREHPTCSYFTEEAGLEMMHMWCSGHVPINVRNKTEQELTASRHNSIANLDQAIKQAEKAKWKAVEQFKV